MTKVKIYDKLHEREILSALNGGKPTLTPQQFLGKEAGTSYFAPDTFIAFAKSLRPQELDQLDQVFTSMKEGLRVVGSLVRRQDKGGRDYTYLNTNRVNATIGFKFILEQGMTSFLEDYMNGKFTVGFTLEVLIEEAMKG